MSETVFPYSQVPINKDVIPQNELDITNKTRSNLFAWKGQFSPQFIETLLTYYALPTDIIYDPFLGSGTTLCESARKGLPAFGTELNVSAYYMAKTYELVNLTIAERKSLLVELNIFISQISESSNIVPILTDYIKTSPNSYASNLLSTLIILLDVFNNELSIGLLRKKWFALQNIVINLPYSKQEIHVERADARHGNVKDNSASLLITSPPYINVFNYHQKYRKSVEALGYDVLKIARNEFGANRKNRGNRLLTVIQYCIDMALSLSEASRICKENVRMIYIVGRESNVLGYSFCNSQLIYEIGTEIFHFPFLIRQERVFKNRFGQIIYEDILSFSNTKSATQISHEDIVNQARIIAVRMLQEKQKLFPDNKNNQLLINAITKADNVLESEG